MDDAALHSLGQTIVDALGDAVTGSSVAAHELTVTAKAERIVEVMGFLRDDARCRFVGFIDVTAVDRLGRVPRFDVVYHLLSPYKNTRVAVRIAVDEATTVPSITSVFRGAEWYERETYDLYGVIFTDHPDLRRILTDYGFDGHPLRKDFPLSGFQELR